MSKLTNPVLEAIAGRRSNRGFSPQPVTEAQLDAIMTAAEQSPSARNAQPWHFTVVRNKALIAEINAAANQALGREDDIFYDAPLAIFISCDSGKWGRLDSGIATQTIALAAHSLGLGSVILGLPGAAFEGDKADYFAKKLLFPEGHTFAVAIAVGTPTVTKEAHPIEPDRVKYVD